MPLDIFFGIVPLIIVVSIAFLVHLLTITFDNSNKRQKQANEQFLQLLKGNIDNGIILDLDVILNIKQSVERQHSTEIIVSNMLQDILVKVNDPSNSDEVGKQEERNKKISNLILEENEAAPFENLPEEERRLFRGLEDAIKNSDKSSIKFHFGELNTVISMRNIEYTKASKMTRWSVPLAVIGLSLTVIFGVMGMKGPNEKDLKNSIISTIQSELKAANKLTQSTADASTD